jgi:glycosyltransferase 2 family protein
MRLLVTAGLLWALLANADVSRANELLDHISLPILAAGVTALLAASPFSALRWHIVLGAETTSPGPWTLLKIVLVGLFFNQALPSGVGGDAVRAWRCHRLGIGVAPAIRSLVLDRVSGYVVMVALFAAGLPVLLHILPDVRQRYGVVVLLGAALCGLLALFLIDYLPRRLLRFRLIAELAVLSRVGRRLYTPGQRCRWPLWASLSPPSALRYLPLCWWRTVLE